MTEQDEVKSFIRSLLKSKAEEIKNMSNFREMMEMKGVKYTEGFECALSEAAALIVKK